MKFILAIFLSITLGWEILPIGAAEVSSTTKAQTDSAGERLCVHC
jgi:hypothetical protein